VIVCCSRRGRRAWWLRAAAITPWLTIRTVAGPGGWGRRLWQA
jgi:hypothetical protein